MTLDEAIAECPVIAIVRGIHPDEVDAHAEAFYQAGVRGIEVPLNSPDPIESVRRLAAAYGDRMALGAGTVLQPSQVDEVAKAGGRIIVAPNTSCEVIRRAVTLRLDPAPGFGTVTEAFMAISAGARHLKLFPAVTFGPAYVAQLKAVLPDQVVIWAVGGVGAPDLANWWRAGARAFGLGSELYRPGQSVSETAEKAKGVVAALRALA